MDNDLVLAIFGARYLSTSRSHSSIGFKSMSMNADFDRSRYTSVRSRSGLDENWKQVQSDGLDMRA